MPPPPSRGREAPHTDKKSRLSPLQLINLRLFRLYEKEMVALSTSDSMGDLLEANSPSTLGNGLADAMGL